MLKIVKTDQKNCEKKIRKMLKKSEKIEKKKIRKNNRKIINYTCKYVYMTYWQYLIKVGRRKKKKIEKYFKSSCLRELKSGCRLNSPMTDWM